MFIIYELLGFILLIFSPIIILIRIILGKEDIIRFKEKFCIFSEKPQSREIIWIHGASLGEILSIIRSFINLKKIKKLKKF